MLVKPALLVVEDDVAVMTALDELLSFSGYRVITARSLEDAEAALQHAGEAAIQLVLSDVHLTSRSDAWEGYGLYQHWASVRPSLPFILMSAYPSSGDLPEVAAEEVRCLQKPFAIETLLHCIQEALARQTRPTYAGEDRLSSAGARLPAVQATAPTPMPGPATAWR